MSNNRTDQSVLEDQVNCDEDDDGKLQLEIIWVRIVHFFLFLSLAKGKVS